MKAMFELHIEQARSSKPRAADIGVVTHGQGLSSTEVTITARVPARRRCRCGANAGLGMARVLEKVDEIALSRPYAVGAAGHIEVFLFGNVIPGKAVFMVDFRHSWRRHRGHGEAAGIEGDRIAAEMGPEISYEKVEASDPVKSDEGCDGGSSNAAEKLGYSHMNIAPRRRLRCLPGQPGGADLDDHAPCVDGAVA
ncbi:MAG: hypothetical protein R3D80_12690 [Paracoccaceae bacterium]